LGEDVLNRINFVMKNAKVKVFRPTLSDMYRLALMYKYGGVYFDVATVSLQNFDWIIDIAKLPSQFIFNRFGELP